MPSPAGRPRFVTFGRFELDLRTGELTDNGQRTQLQPKAFELLAALLERPGDIVTRDELRARLWPSDTYVGFDDSINHAVRKLRECLGDSSDHPAYVETIPRHGYRFVAPVTVALEGEGRLSPGSSSTPLQTEPAGVPGTPASERGAPVPGPPATTALAVAMDSPDARRPRPPRPGRLGTSTRVAGVLLLLAAVAAAFWVWSASSVRNRERLMLAVLPVQNMTGSEDQDYLSEGLTEELTSELSRLNPDALAVIARSSAATFKKRVAGIADVGRQLGVEFIVEGSLRRSGDRLRITLQLVRVSDQSCLWSESYDRDDDDILSVQRDVAERTAGALALTLLPATVRRLDSAADTPIAPDAREAYLRGRYELSRGTGPTILKANQYLQEAVRLAPNSALAHAALATSWLFLTNYDVVPVAEGSPKARAAAEQALRLDPSEPQAQLVRAGLKFEHEWDFAGAEAAFRAALRERPTAQGHQWYSALLSALGRHQEAVDQMQRARRLDPLSLRVGVDLGRAYYFARQHDRAIAEYHRIIDLEPNYSAAHSLLGLALVEKGQHEAGIAALEMGRNLLRTSEGFSIWLGYAYAVAGRRDEAEHMLARQRENWERRHTGAIGAALTCVGLGDADRAFEWLDRAYQERAGMTMLRAYPYWDRIRSDARFRDLLRRVGLDR